jgi:hypothetical protein
MRRLGLILSLLIVGSLVGLTSTDRVATGQEKNEPLPQSSKDCGKCHTCDNPLPDNPCLHECPRMEKEIVPSEAVSVESSPDTVILKELSNLYMPVVFPHRLHARMSVMGGGCTLCHHYTPTKESHPPCKKCHQKGISMGDLRKPGLKGAYHRQCLGCHRDWSHTTECAVCHVKRAGGPLAPTVKDQSDIIGVEHPIITVPETKIYQTKYTKGPIVTFHHEEHIQLFDLRCVDCHKKENCGKCHYMGKHNVTEAGHPSHHQPCFSCHEGYSCDFCHRMKERPKFTHVEVGWPQNKYHRKLVCRACHPRGRKIGKLNTECTSCHMNWYPGSFNHMMTGVNLGDCHEGLDCSGCHVDREFDAKPTCNNCHDDGRSYPSSPLCRR